MPENLEGLTHFVKLLMTNLLAALLGVSPVIALPISMIDLLPLVTESKSVRKVGELVLQIPR
jgi:hypothetical protein